MVNKKICYESKDRSFISNLSFQKLAEYLCIETRVYDKDTNEVSYDCTELAVDDNEIRALRDFLNGLKLRSDD